MKLFQRGVLALLVIVAGCVDVVAASTKAAPAASTKKDTRNDVALPSGKDTSAKTDTKPTTAGQVLTFKKRPSADSGTRYSSNDWLITIISTPTSYVLKRIRFHLMANVAICLAVLHFYPTNPSLSIPMTGHSLLGSSLGLLLSYRTNSAYARFWEARGHWSKTKAVCRNLAITIKNHIEPHAPKASAKFLELLAAYPSALMHLCLGGQVKVQNYVQKHIPFPETEDLYADAPALPAIYLCMELHHTIHAAAEESRTSSSNMLEALHLAECSHLIDSLLDGCTFCEKILRTPVPWTYSRHTSRFLTLWMATLPFALVKDLKPSLVLAIVFLAGYCMLGIEEISHLIEQPFLGDPLNGSDQIWSAVDGGGEASTLIKRGLATQPYDIGIPVCSLAKQIRNEVIRIAAGGHKKTRLNWL